MELGVRPAGKAGDMGKGGVPMLDYRDIWLLEVLISVIDNGSMAAAARERHLTTPTVSEAIAKLEKLVGAPLLVRAASGCHPTADGRRVETSARELLAASAVQLRVINNPNQTAYRVGSTFGAQSMLTADVSRRHDSPTLTPVSLGLEDPGQQLINGDADMALLMGPTQHDHLFHREPVLIETRFAIVGVEAIPPGLTSLPLEMLDELQWPSIPVDADQVFLGPWLCNDLRPGPPKRQGPALNDILAFRDWMVSNRNDVVVPTTKTMAEMFKTIEGVAVLPIAAEGWNVDLVGPAENAALIAEIARLMRMGSPSTEST